MVMALDNEIIRLRKEAGRFRSLHGRAKKRLDDQRAKHRDKIAKLKAEHKAREEALKRKVLELKLQVKKVQELHFGKSSEKSRSFSGDLGAGRSKHKKKRPRGQQRGRKGHGRRLHAELSCEDELHDLSANERKCPVCGLPYQATVLENVSEEVEFEVRLYRRRKHRPQYKPSCSCHGIPALNCSPVPPRAFTRSSYSDNFWVEILLLKYEYQLPLERIVGLLTGHGLHGVAPGTLCGGIVRAAQMLTPWHDAVVEHNKAALLRHMDETGLKVFVVLEGKKSQLWCLWQSSTKDTCVFFLSPCHNADIPEAYLLDSPEEGTVCVDRHKAYSHLKQALAYCWAHVRRDFVKLARSERGSLGWAIGWIKRIKGLYRLNRGRIAAKNSPEALSEAQVALRGALREIEQQCGEELSRPYNWTTVNRRKVLESMQRHWEGLTVFLRDPDIPMDNNFAERLFRPVANFRKASYGVHSKEFGEITALLLSVFATLRLNGIAPRAFLVEYFAAVAAAGGANTDTAVAFRPWNLPEDLRKRLVRVKDPPDSS
ncbi:MAG: IS66 family transposase [Lentisphaeria bacterium]|nr:IS66 family transposase [Lentisphaeria bacterium]